MNAIVARLVKKGAQEAVKKAIKYIKDDQSQAYGLDGAVGLDIRGRGVADIVRTAYATRDGSLSITVAETDHVRIIAHPFPASARLWNGPDIIPDNDYAAMLASLFHDLIWEHCDELAAAWGVSRDAVLRWGNEVLYTIWRFAEPKSRMARIAYGVCNFASGWYHSLKRLVGLGCAAAMLALCGCGAFDTPQGWTVAEMSGTNAVIRAMQGAKKTSSPAAATVADEAPLSSKTPAGDSSSTASGCTSDAVDFARLLWPYGGFRGGEAVFAPGCEIADLRVSSSGLSYRWVSGGCEALGATSRGDTDHTLACLFVQGKDGSWRGGKFDWISTSRTTRDFANVRGGYHGWPTDAIETATAYAFVIVSKDGRRRSNVITCGR